MKAGAGYRVTSRSLTANKFRHYARGLSVKSASWLLKADLIDRQIKELSLQPALGLIIVNCEIVVNNCTLT